MRSQPIFHILTIPFYPSCLITNLVFGLCNAAFELEIRKEPGPLLFVLRNIENITKGFPFLSLSFFFVAEGLGWGIGDRSGVVKQIDNTQNKTTYLDILIPKKPLHILQLPISSQTLGPKNDIIRIRRIYGAFISHDGIPIGLQVLPDCESAIGGILDEGSPHSIRIYCTAAEVL